MAPPTRLLRLSSRLRWALDKPEQLARDEPIETRHDGNVVSDEPRTTGDTGWPDVSR